MDAALEISRRNLRVQARRPSQTRSCWTPQANRLPPSRLPLPLPLRLLKILRVRLARVVEERALNPHTWKLMGGRNLSKRLAGVFIPISTPSPVCIFKTVVFFSADIGDLEEVIELSGDSSDEVTPVRRRLIKSLDRTPGNSKAKALFRPRPFDSDTIEISDDANEDTPIRCRPAKYIESTIGKGNANAIRQPRPVDSDVIEISDDAND